MREKLLRFMRGRYGRNDTLNSVLLGAAVLFFLLGFLMRIFALIALMLIVITYYRMLSRNIYKRAAENQAFQRRFGNLIGFAKGRKNRIGQYKAYRFFRCPNCKQDLRVPKGKGRIEIRCKKCGTTFVKKS